jgi:CO/xanthine dehydrogenase Mo-binding subunit
MANDEHFSVIGTRPPRVDAAEKVTGRAKYWVGRAVAGDGLRKVLRSPHAHARIVSIDTRAAESLRECTRWSRPPIC